MKRSLFKGASRAWAGRFGAFLLATLAVSAHAFDLQAHRGGRALWPENTLRAFDRSLTLGVSTLELDIGLTADNVVVISHDTALNPDHTRDANGAWLTATGPKIRALTLAELQRYDVGRLNPASDYGKPFAAQEPRDGERVPTLAALFDLVKARGDTRVRFNIEPKTDPTKPDDTAAPEAMVRALLAEIDKAGMQQRVTVQSFDWRALAAVGQLAPQMPRAWLTSARTLKDSRWTAGLEAASFPSTPQLVRAAAGERSGPIVWSPSGYDVTVANVREAQSMGFRVIPWTVNKRVDMTSIMRLGVDGLITDQPDVLREVLRSQGIPLPTPTAP
ncbi:MAG: glycerophosphodiester phosphodiesterase [Variovorax sp.]|nr:MAG: glycerophosphodiester phosphodiesterase [Variovorax sp.]